MPKMLKVLETCPNNI